MAFVIDSQDADKRMQKRKKLSASAKINGAASYFPPYNKNITDVFSLRIAERRRISVLLERHLLCKKHRPSLLQNIIPDEKAFSNSFEQIIIKNCIFY